MGEYRAERVGRLIQEKIGGLILGESIKDPRVNSFTSITRVKVSKDFSYADVYVSNIREETHISKCVLGLQNAAGFIQTQLASSMRIRKTPKLRFHEDASIREGFDMIKKIENLNAGTENGPSGD